MRNSGASPLPAQGHRVRGQGQTRRLCRRDFRNHEADNRLREPLLLLRGEKRLRIQLADADGEERLLLFSEEDMSATQSQLQRLGLTPRESEVMLWMAEGKTNAEIGAVLNVSPRTVENHVAQILTKLAVENRACAIIRAMEHSARNGHLPAR